MATRTDTAVRPVLRLTWLFLVQLFVVLFVVGFPLAVLSGDTDEYFAWTIAPPLTAAFLGACYWSASAFALACLPRRDWASVRIIFFGIAMAGTLLLLATFLHFDRFHMETPRGWIWLVLYLLLPPSLVLLVALQLRTPGGDRATLTAVPSWMRAVFAAQALVLIGVGAALFVGGDDAASLWPWELTDLTARAVGAWTITVGTTLVASCRETEWANLRAPMISYTVLAVLQLVMLARYSDTPDWDEPSSWIYVAFLAGVLAVALYGLRCAERAERRRPAGAPPGPP